MCISGENVYAICVLIGAFTMAISGAIGAVTFFQCRRAGQIFTLSIAFLMILAICKDGITINSIGEIVLSLLNTPITILGWIMVIAIAVASFSKKKENNKDDTEL